jgi:type IV secretory pathway protease TraF
VTRGQVIALIIIALVLAVSVLFEPWNRESSRFVAVAHPEHQCLPWTVFWAHRAPVGEPAVGDLVLVSPDGLDIPGLEGQTLMKFVVGTEGAEYVVDEGYFYIDGFRYGDINHQDLIRYEGSKTVKPGYVLVAGVTGNVIDSRYLGEIRVENLVGTARPLLAWNFDTTYHGQYEKDITDRLDWIFGQRHTSVGGDTRAHIAVHR